MLLWLTLTLLWSSPCWAGRKSGEKAGGTSAQVKDKEKRCQGDRVWAGPVALPPSIQVRYGSSWSEKYGIPGGKAHELILHPGEHIISIYGRYRTFLQHVTLITNQGRSASFGLETGKGFFAAPNLTGQVLEGVYGQFWLYGITGIGFTWGFPREGLASVLPSDDPF
uniref:Jacalin-type lectin domain-containing protein n=1 Tax=Sus scrofa TaxID=9823 RepID=A0A8D1HGB3_PIG